jgi:predicted nucleic acid-binding protein
VTHLLDTSALLTHFLGKPGADQVAELLAKGPEAVFLSSPSWVELDRRLNLLISDEIIRERIFQHYTQDLCGLVILDRAASLAAMRIQKEATKRLPLVDTLIAGCARAANLTLVHRDPHFDSVPKKLLKTLRLPGKR